MPGSMTTTSTITARTEFLRAKNETYAYQSAA
jgi:hypothetical protein